jgi:hypothetical protein
MALRINADADIIKDARDQIINAFRRYGAERVSTVIGYPGGNQSSKVYWAEDLGIWLACDVIEKSRYWNAFGTRNPKQNKMVPICCEINFPLSGVDRRIGGAVAEDERGRLFLVHRGQIGGGRKGIGAELFWKHFDGKPSIVVDGDRETELVVVGSIDSPRLLRQIQFFVREVERIKALARPADHPASPDNDGGESVEIQDIGEEFEGTKTYTVTRKIGAGCDHAIIVNRLRQRLREKRYSTGKDRFRDLYVHRKGGITSLFEVKPDTSTTSIYTAVGQLLIYSVVQTTQPKLVFVAPEELSVQTRNKLKKIGIDVLGYRWVDGEPDFPGLADWQF